jgi:hypothetical protein
MSSFGVLIFISNGVRIQNGRYMKVAVRGEDFARFGMCKRGQSTGRQLPPLSSVLYRIIYKRRYILAAQLLLREKSGT